MYLWVCSTGKLFLSVDSIVRSCCYAANTLPSSKNRGKLLKITVNMLQKGVSQTTCKSELPTTDRFPLQETSKWYLKASPLSSFDKTSLDAEHHHLTHMDPTSLYLPSFLPLLTCGGLRLHGQTHCENDLSCSCSLSPFSPWVSPLPPPKNWIR